MELVTEMSSVLEIAALLFCVGNSSISVVEEAYETKSKKKFATRWYARCEQLPQWNMTWK